MRTIALALPLLLSTLTVACAVEPAAQEAPIAEPRTGATVAALQAEVDVFTNALVDRDLPALEGIVSSEIIARGKDRGIDMPKFLEKQRSALVATFKLAEGDRPALEVAEIAEEGEAVRATLRFRGEELKKPFYFVREGKDLKLNIAPPGFSKAAPDGAIFGKSNYTVRNDMIPGNGNLILGCYQGKLSNGQHKPYAQVSVPPVSSRKVACEDACGYWAGTFFTDGGSTKHCDWNAFGADVILGVYGGTWVCADYC